MALIADRTVYRIASRSSMENNWPKLVAQVMNNRTYQKVWKWWKKQRLSINYVQTLSGDGKASLLERADKINHPETDIGPTLTRAGHADRHQVLFLRQISGNRSSDYQNRRGVRSYSRRVEIFLLALLSINAVIGNPTEAFHPLPRGQSHCFRCCDLLRSQQRLDTFLPTTWG